MTQSKTDVPFENVVLSSENIVSSISQSADTIDHLQSIVNVHCTDIVPQVVPSSRVSTRSKSRPAWWNDYNIKVPNVFAIKTIDS